MYYDEYWEEPSEFEQQVEEFKDALRNSVKDEIKEKIASLAQIRTAKELEEKWKKARLHQLLGDYLTVGWKARGTREYGEKCDKCDDDRKIHFYSPQGKEYKEDCQCAKYYYKYLPKEATISKMYVRKKNFSSDSKADFYNRYYEVEEEDDTDIYSLASEVYASSDFDYAKVNSYRAVFLNEEDCAKYCDWLTEKSMNELLKL